MRTIAERGEGNWTVLLEISELRVLLQKEGLLI